MHALELTELAVSKGDISIWASIHFWPLVMFSGLSRESTPGEAQDSSLLQEGGRFGNLCLDSLADAYKFSSRAEDDPFLSITDGSAVNLV